ncbi:hypothetical protein GMORB2_6348 [Geosmithia morbida]|uniref:Uncharacterized protein n=1 Tax=Geosmithia morbida TaxID=1094350 RepID=A0A9P5D2A3_9HYPO|nr:uncharacterized protein GMORB2_6348 [Geosmithia morbida]KAF4123647.1 hypothetical protein GMORB2_6348 [Geosmithia morbida]
MKLEIVSALGLLASSGSAMPQAPSGSSCEQVEYQPAMCTECSASSTSNRNSSANSNSNPNSRFGALLGKLGARATYGGTGSDEQGSQCIQACPEQSTQCARYEARNITGATRYDLSYDRQEVTCGEDNFRYNIQASIENCSGNDASAQCLIVRHAAAAAAAAENQQDQQRQQQGQSNQRQQDQQRGQRVSPDNFRSANNSRVSPDMSRIGSENSQGGADITQLNLGLFQNDLERQNRY